MCAHRTLRQHEQSLTNQIQARAHLCHPCQVTGEGVTAFLNRDVYIQKVVASIWERDAQVIGHTASSQIWASNTQPHCSSRIEDAHALQPGAKTCRTSQDLIEIVQQQTQVT